MSSSASFTIKLKVFTGVSLPLWFAQVKTYLEVKGIWDDVCTPTPDEPEVKEEREANAVTGAATPKYDVLLRQKMATSIIMAALNDTTLLRYT